MKLRGFALPILFLTVALVALLGERVVQPDQRPGRIKITYWEKWTGFEGDAIRAVVDDFNKSQDRIFVELLTVSNLGDKVLLSVAGGIPPDVAGLWGFNTAQYADSQALEPLDDYCRQYGIEAEDYVPVFWNMGFYKGRVYALPSTPASTALHYNLELFSKAGLDPQRPPKTIEELDAMADKLVVKDAQGRIRQSGFMPSEPGWWNWGWSY
ncbi:MAG TPA: extracellular solute-binding protein, partial [Fimbriimonadaceae bacterium]|nr:extracellular solute-binding protein [Fimbriimonadaceae bacterium]